MLVLTKTIFDSINGEEVLNFIKSETFYRQRGDDVFSNLPYIIKNFGGFKEVITLPVQVITLFSNGDMANEQPIGDIDEFLLTAAGLSFVLPRFENKKGIGELRAEVSAGGKLINVHYFEYGDTLLHEAEQKGEEARQAAIERDEGKDETVEEPAGEETELAGMKQQPSFQFAQMRITLKNCYKIISMHNAVRMSYDNVEKQDIPAPQGILVRPDGSFTVQYDDGMCVGIFKTIREAQIVIFKWFRNYYSKQILK